MGSGYVLYLYLDPLGLDPKTILCRVFGLFSALGLGSLTPVHLSYRRLPSEPGSPSSEPFWGRGTEVPTWRLQSGSCSVVDAFSG